MQTHEQLVAEPTAKITDYPFEIRPLAAQDGGGVLVSFPDFCRVHLGWGDDRGSLGQRP